MKKITLTVLASLATIVSGFSQANYVNLPIPLNDGATSAFRGPNGTAGYASQRSIMFIHEWELLPMTTSSITSIKFQYSAGASSAVNGNMTLWLQNTSDQDMLKPNSFSAVTATITQVYSGPFIVPSSPGNVTINLPTPFGYTGGGLYVAWDFQSAGPFATTAATLTSNSSTNWIYYNASSTGPVNTFTAGSIFRPSLLFSATNTSTNEVRAVRIQTGGKVSRLESATQPVYVTVVNSSFLAQNNVTVALNATGANPYTTANVIASMPAGAVQTLTFASYPTPNSGLSTLTGGVAILTDQNLNNNTKVITQSVSCNVVSLPQPTVPVTDYLTTCVGNGATTSFVHLTGTSASSIGGVNVIIPSFANAANLGAQVYPVVSDASGNVVASGNTLTIAAGNMDVLQPLTFASPVNLTPNTLYLFGVGTTASGYFPVGLVPLTNIVPGYYLTPTGGGAPQQALFGPLGLEAVLVYPSTAIGISATPSVACSNAPVQVTLTANGGTGLGNYVWSTGGTGPSIVVTSPNTNTVYSVSGTNVNSSCSGASAIPFNVINLSINATATTGQSTITTVCKGKVATLKATGATSYVWSGTITSTAPTVTVAPLILTTYTVYGTEPTAGCKSNSVALTVSVSACVGIAVNSANSDGIYIFPNPANGGKSEISGLSGMNTISVYNLLGEMIINEKTEKETYELNFSNQPNGTYLVKILDSYNNSKIVKIINQN